MNIKFGMDNFYTKYLKRFLNHELQKSKTILGPFEKEDLEMLIKYLNLPNTKTIFEVYKELNEKFPELKTLFTPTLEDDEIIWNAKNLSITTAEFLQTNINAISKYCETVGWKIGDVSSWMDSNFDLNGDGIIDDVDKQILNNIVFNNVTYDEEIMKKADINLDGFINYEDIMVFDKYRETTKMYISIISEKRKNIFPNEDMKVFVNQFTGDFLYNYAIRDNGEGYDDVVHPNSSGKYKVGLYQCKPRTKTYNIT